VAAGVELDALGACVAVLRAEPELAEEDDVLFVDEEAMFELLEVPDEGRELAPEELDEPLAAVFFELFLTGVVAGLDVWPEA
jgi:hypothetical protein